MCAVFDLNINAIQRNEAVDDADRPRERGKDRKLEREREGGKQTPSGV